MSKSSGSGRSDGKMYDSAAGFRFFIIASVEQDTEYLFVEDPPEGMSGKCVRCFLSPVDALIDASLAKFGRAYDAVPATGIKRGLLVDKVDGLVACIHQARITKEHTPILRRKGRLVAQAHLIQTHRKPETRMFRFNLEPRTFQILDRTYEHARLFAWRETLAEVSRWSRARLDDTVRGALQTMSQGA